MRVLFCTLDYPPSAAGGAEQQARLQAEALVRRGYRVTVVCARTPGQSSGVMNGVRVERLHRIEIKYLRTPSYLAVLAAYLLLRVGRYELVHVHLANLQADIAVAIARLFRRPTYLKVAAGGPLGEVGRMKLVSWFTRFYGLRHADAVQAISDEIAADVARIGVQPSRIHRIPNGVAIAHAPGRAERTAARHALGLAADHVIAIYVGRMERAKGILDLLSAWTRLGRENARLLLIGRPGLKEPVRLTELPPSVAHHSWTPRVDAYLAAADIFVLPSYAEGMSNALLEAMAAGVACVTSSVGAAPEMVVDGVNGLLIEAGDRTALVYALRRLVDDPGARQALGARARADVVARYGIEAVVDRIESAYQSMVRSS